MTRALVEEIGLFLVPFVVFALYLMLSRKSPLTRESWASHVPWLAVVGLLLAAGFLVWSGVMAERKHGTFVPPHMEDGRLVPGYFK